MDDEKKKNTEEALMIYRSYVTCNQHALQNFLQKVSRHSAVTPELYGTIGDFMLCQEYMMVNLANQLEEISSGDENTITCTRH